MESKEHNDRLFNERAERLDQYRDKVTALEAENADLRRELIRVIHATGGQCTDDVSTSFLMHAADEVTGKLADLRAKLAATGWQRIDTEKYGRDEGFLCALKDSGIWHISSMMMTPGFALDRGYTHLFILPAPPNEGE